MLSWVYLLMEKIAAISLAMSEYINAENAYLTFLINSLSTLSLVLTTISLIAVGIYTTLKPFLQEKVKPGDVKGD